MKKNYSLPIIIALLSVAVAVGVIFLAVLHDFNAFEPGMSSNIVSGQNKLRSILADSHASNIDSFLSWVDDFNQDDDAGCGITKRWVKTDKLTYNDTACMDRYEKRHDQMDGDCRITAFALLMDNFTTKKVIKDAGSYLMFDLDVIENNKDYAIVKQNLDKFVTVFNEIDVSGVKTEELVNIFSQKWSFLVT